jgi:hypothetical protein
MELSFQDDDLQRQCSHADSVLKAWGPTLGPVVRRRILQLAAAETVAILRSLPFGQLTRQSDGSFVWRTRPPLEIAFVACGSIAPPDQEADMTAISVTAITVFDD